MIVAATGHRPEKLGGYDLKTRRALGALAVEYLHEVRPELIISGMAQGWDQAVAAACVALGIPFVAAIPFEGQERKWSPEAQARYFRLRAAASEEVVLFEGLPVGTQVSKAFLARDHWMVDEAEQMVALWDGSWSGTFNTIQYAEKRGRPVINLWARWVLPQDLRDLLG